jgi:hypothetical protein
VVGALRGDALRVKVADLRKRERTLAAALK